MRRGVLLPTADRSSRQKKRGENDEVFLPPGWENDADDVGNEVFFSAVTGEHCWELPQADGHANGHGNRNSDSNGPHVD